MMPGRVGGTRRSAGQYFLCFGEGAAPKGSSSQRGLAQKLSTNVHVCRPEAHRDTLLTLLASPSNSVPGSCGRNCYASTHSLSPRYRIASHIHLYRIWSFFFNPLLDAHKSLLLTY
jgi:hypothetical protein